MYETFWHTLKMHLIIHAINNNKHRFAQPLQLLQLVAKRYLSPTQVGSLPCALGGPQGAGGGLDSAGSWCYTWTPKKYSYTWSSGSPRNPSSGIGCWQILSPDPPGHSLSQQGTIATDIANDEWILKHGSSAISGESQDQWQIDTCIFPNPLHC